MTGRTLDQVNWPVRTPRLSLRPAVATDLKATWQFRQLPEVSRWLTRAPATLRDYRAQFLDPESLAKSIVIELDNQVVGDVMLQIDQSYLVRAQEDLLGSVVGLRVTSARERLKLAGARESGW
ncbi:GNAT family N-acetyltransferase [Nocardioides gansuensis]|nr:hypothetical protein [Nocardioides gansuensis]